MPLNDRLGLGNVSLGINLNFSFLQDSFLCIQMLVVGPLLQIAAFLVQYLELPFPIFALSFGLGGIGKVFQVDITLYPVKNYI
jgi:hypothetical protein